MSTRCGVEHRNGEQQAGDQDADEQKEVVVVVVAVSDEDADVVLVEVVVAAASKKLQVDPEWNETWVWDEPDESTLLLP